MQEYTVKVFDNRTVWYQNNKLHRLDGPAIEWSSGGKTWYQNGQLHRIDGPAVEYVDGWYKAWYQNGLLHRLDGPAVELSNGDKYWYIDGVKLSKSQFNKRTAKKELTISEIEELLGYSIKIIK